MAAKKVAKKKVTKKTAKKDKPKNIVVDISSIVKNGKVTLIEQRHRENIIDAIEETVLDEFYDVLPDMVSEDRLRIKSVIKRELIESELYEDIIREIVVSEMQDLKSDEEFVELIHELMLACATDKDSVTKAKVSKVVALAKKKVTKKVSTKGGK